MLLPVCIVLTVLAVILAVLLWLRDRRGNAVQALGLAALPMGLYACGLAPLVVDGARALAGWARQLVVNPIVGTGLGLIGLAVVLWLLGGWLARRRAARPAAEPRPAKAPKAVDRTTSAPAARRPGAGKPAAQQSGDPEMDEIEALLKARGIE